MGCISHGENIEGQIKVEKEYRSFQAVNHDIVRFVIADPGRIGYEVLCGDAGEAHRRA